MTDRAPKSRRTSCQRPSPSCSSSPSGSTSPSSNDEAAGEKNRHLFPCNCWGCKLPESLPYAKGRETSKAAAESMKKKAPAIREEIFAAIKHMGTDGLTCDEAEEDLFLTHQTCSARFNELWNRGRIADSGQRRPTRSGRKAIVFVVATHTKGDQR